MNQRKLGKTNKMVSEMVLGTWQLEIKWSVLLMNQKSCVF